MRRSNLDRARREAVRFLHILDDLRAKHDEHREMQKDPSAQWVNNPLNGTKESAAVRRASMDLTRTLAEMRKP